MVLVIAAFTDRVRCQLEEALHLSAADLKYSCTAIQSDLDRFQRQKVADLREMCIAMAKSHRDWAKKVSVVVFWFFFADVCDGRIWKRGRTRRRRLRRFLIILIGRLRFWWEKVKVGVGAPVRVPAAAKGMLRGGIRRRRSMGGEGVLCQAICIVQCHGIIHHYRSPVIPSCIDYSVNLGHKIERV